MILQALCTGTTVSSVLEISISSRVERPHPQNPEYCSLSHQSHQKLFHINIILFFNTGLGRGVPRILPGGMHIFG
jgi:hypothetical protein